jgi:hypothetical protein
MAMLIWKAPMSYWSPRDETAFFSWLQSIPGVVSARGIGRELHISLRSKRLSAEALRELIALYKRYGGNSSELATFLNPTNEHWFQDPQAYWYSAVFGRQTKPHSGANSSDA